MITKKTLNKKISLIMYRQNMLAEVIIKMQLPSRHIKTFEEEWSKAWELIMEGEEND